MACYHPLKAVVLPEQTENGKKVIKFVPNNTKQYLYTNKEIGYKQILKSFIEIPCGNCIGCRLAYSREWANRCILEAKNYEFNEFITLTYDNEHLPMSEGVDLETGEVRTVATLEPKHLQKFMKDLRRYFEYHYNHTDIRFYACGEYGDEKERPHYHLIVFNLPVPDKEFYFTNKKGNINYHSDIIQKIWGKGLTSLCPVTWETCAYTARYVMKKQKGKGAKEYYSDIGKVAEFVRMSRNPGIARDYYEQNKDKIYECDEIFIKKSDKTEKVRPSKYYDRLFDIENPERLERLKKIRKKFAEEVAKSQLHNTSLSAEEYLRQQELKKLNQAKKLLRNYERGM